MLLLQRLGILAVCVTSACQSGAGGMDAGAKPTTDLGRGQVRTDVDCGAAAARPDAASFSTTPPTNLGAGFVLVPYALPPGVVFPPAGLMYGDFAGLTGAVGGDIDGDGDPEVLMGAINSSGAATLLAWTYRRASGALVPAALPDVRGGALPMSLLDLDGDGNLDLIENRPSIAWGRGGGRFDQPVQLGPRSSPESPTSMMALQVQDVDGDGWLDLLLGQRMCCSTCKAYFLLLRTGPRTFVDRTELIADNPSGGTYAVMASPLGPDPMVLATFSTCATGEAAFHRQASLDADGLPRFVGFDPTPADASYRQPRPQDCPTLACRAPMGAWVGFIDDDAMLDLSVSLHPDHEIFRGGCTWPLAELAPSPAFTETRGVETARSMIPWAVAYLDIDCDGRPDALHVHGNDFIPDDDPVNFIGVQHPTLHWNAGGMRFVDVTPLTGLQQQLGHWRSLWVGDLDRDGDADLLMGGHRFAPRVLRNDVATGHHGLALALRGDTSNHYGLGAEVLVQASASTPPMRFMMGGISSPHAVSDPLIFVGLGAATQAARVEVRWPSGVVQVVEGLAAGQVHTLQEPPLLRIEPASRHVAADGQSLVTFRFTPPADAPVELAITHGGGEIVAAPHREGDAWVATVRAPAHPGSTRFELRVNGAASGVHPRVWWDG